MKKARKPPWKLPCSFLLLGNAFPRTEKKRNTPNSCKSNDRVDDSAQDRILSAEDPRHDVKLKKSDASPVERAYYGNDQSDSIHYHIKFASVKIDRKNRIPPKIPSQIFSPKSIAVFEFFLENYVLKS